jgi:hypothetical protein
MDRRTFLSAGAMALGSTWSPVWAEEEMNAAPHYRKAFLLLPKLSEAQTELIESVPAAPVNRLGLDLIKQSDPALREMTRGSQLEDCDWGSDYFANIGTLPMVEINKVTRLACLRAHYAFQDKQSGAAIADLSAVIKMARQIGRRGHWMATLTQIAIENRVIDLAAAHLPTQEANTLKALGTCLESLPKSGSLRESTRGEREFLLQHTRPRYLNKSTEEAVELLRKDLASLEEILSKEVASDEKARAVLKSAGGDAKGVLKIIDEAAELDDELARISILPSADFRRALSDFRNKHKEPNPFVLPIDDSDSAVACLESMRYAVDRTEARFAMLSAAMKVVVGGTEQLKAITDPFGVGPFKYRSFDGGFELKSGLELKDRPPVIVTVGFEKKE